MRIHVLTKILHPWDAIWSVESGRVRLPPRLVLQQHVAIAEHEGAGRALLPNAAAEAMEAHILTRARIDLRLTDESVQRPDRSQVERWLGEARSILCRIGMPGQVSASRLAGASWRRASPGPAGIPARCRAFSGVTRSRRLRAAALVGGFSEPDSAGSRPTAGSGRPARNSHLFLGFVQVPRYRPPITMRSAPAYRLRHAHERGQTGVEVRKYVGPVHHQPLETRLIG